MRTKNPVRMTTLKALRAAKHVVINKERVRDLAEKWAAEGISIPKWPKEYHLETDDQRIMLDYLIIADALNFCFWSRKEKWGIRYKGKRYKGYFALSLALKKFFEENSAKANFACLSQISFREFRSILEGEGELLFLKKRWEIMRAVSLYMLDKYDGDSKRFLLSANHSLAVLIPKICKELPYFEDIAYYKNHKVYFLKRAQILGADIWGALDGKGIGYFRDLDYLTAFADYKLPQILNFWGILEYSASLQGKVKRRIIVTAGSEEEIEIRSATVWAVEYLKNALEALGKEFHAFQLDWILWDKSHRAKRQSHHHLTKTIYY